MYSPNKQVGIVDPALATQQQVAQQIPQAGFNSQFNK